uniref:Similar to Serine/threonine protein phosphatase 5 n=1 Tax=Arundo donax TaxID=35708 RepID=A0A0A9GEL9_ARUDO
MNNKDLVVDHMSKRQATKYLSKELNKCITQLGLHLSLKTVYFVHALAFMVSSSKVHSSWIQALECK